MLQKRKKNPKFKPYDNAHFFVFFVMLFYSFLPLTVFLGYSCFKKAISKKDLYQEFNDSKH